MDQQFNEDGTPYGPSRYREIVKECYLISKNINTSYTDLMNITPTERTYMLQFLIEDAKQIEEIKKKRKAERAAKNRYS